MRSRRSRAYGHIHTRFVKRTAIMSKKAEKAIPPTKQFEEMLLDDQRIEELSTTEAEDEEDYDYESASEEESSPDTDVPTNSYDVHGWLGNFKTAPALYSKLPFLIDDLTTPTSTAQDRVAEACRLLMSGEEREINDLNRHGIPRLQKEKHVKFLRKSLNTYPPPYQAMDASRPWILYWALAGLAHLGEDVAAYRERAMQTFGPLQNADGGFGGGHGQMSHGAATYASVLALAIVGGLDMVDRRGMYVITHVCFADWR